MAAAKNKKESETDLPNKTAPPQEVVIQLPLTELHPFSNHPFQVRDDDSMKETTESIKQFGVLVPAKPCWWRFQARPWRSAFRCFQ